MKMILRVVVAVAACAMLVPAYGQFGGRPGMGGPQGPQFTGALAKIFSDNPAFSAGIEIQANLGSQTLTMPARLYFNKGESRMEMDLTAVKGGHMPPQALVQFKAMGIDKMVAINVPEKKMSYVVYPGLQAYCLVPMQSPEASTAESDFKVATTELGKETVNGHDCVKTKVVVTDKDGVTQEFTVWKATDLKNFPVKIEMNQHGIASTVNFSDIKMGASDASLFVPPSDFKQYDSMPAMMQEAMQKHMGNMGGQGNPSAPPPQKQ
jgi:hypothetical protein